MPCSTRWRRSASRISTCRLRRIACGKRCIKRAPPEHGRKNTMYAFTLERPATLADAVKLAAAGAKPLAGGQTLLASMKLRLSAPEQLADLSGVKELTGISKSGNA